MPVTVRNTDILFNDGTTQSTAASAVPAAFDSIGGIVACVRAISAQDFNSTTNRAAIGSTLAGSSLRINYSLPNQGSDISNNYSRPDTNLSYNGGGTALPGTWRCLSRDAVFGFISGYSGFTAWRAGLWIRVA